MPFFQTSLSANRKFFTSQLESQICSPQTVLTCKLISFTCGQFSESEILHRTSGDQRFLRVVQHMSQCVHTHMEVSDVYTHGLFTHSRLVGITRRLSTSTKVMFKRMQGVKTHKTKVYPITWKTRMDNHLRYDVLGDSSVLYCISSTACRNNVIRQ